VIVSFVCPSPPGPLGGVTALYEFANGLSRRGHEVHIAHGAFWGRRIASLDELSWFRFEPDVQHHLDPDAEVVPLPEADIIFGTGAGPEYGLPVLVIQGFEMLFEEIERASFRTPCLKVCVAGWLVGAGMRYGAPEEQLVHVPMGLDHDLFRVVEPIETRPLQVGLLFNAHPAKGFAVGLRALELVHARMPEMRAIIFGTQRPLQPLPEWVTFLEDPLPDTVVRDVYNRCAVFVQSSFNEGFGFTAVEAMACGCALVSTDNGGSSDYAIPEQTALVAPIGDSEKLAQHVEALLRDDERRVGLARAGRELVQAFQWDRAAMMLEGYLEQYLADPARYLAPPLDEDPSLGVAP